MSVLALPASPGLLRSTRARTVFTLADEVEFSHVDDWLKQDIVCDRELNRELVPGQDRVVWKAYTPAGNTVLQNDVMVEFSALDGAFEHFNQTASGRVHPRQVIVRRISDELDTATSPEFCAAVEALSVF